VALDPTQLHAGERLLVAPEGDALGHDLAAAVARVLCSLSQPSRGSVELFGRPTSALDDLQLSELRARLGFVPGSGGLLSNLSLRANIALPLSVHAALSLDAEARSVEQALQGFGLLSAADHHPHEVSGKARFCACAARATMLSPPLLIVESSGDFVSEADPGPTWSQLARYCAQQGAAMVVCLARPEVAFETWFRAQGGSVLRYRLDSEPPRTLERRP
jgi:predicted ABC-type transport system involved in lysophospholipase L1 biosynthesis ATPase subunit